MTNKKGKFVEDLHEPTKPKYQVVAQHTQAVSNTEPAIRTITTGSMQTRFSITEEIAITTGTDEIAKVLLSRLFNAKNTELDLAELQEGVGYIVQYLDTISMLHEGVFPSERLDKLLADGTRKEKFLG